MTLGSRLGRVAAMVEQEAQSEAEAQEPETTQAQRIDAALDAAIAKALPDDDEDDLYSARGGASEKKNGKKALAADDEDEPESDEEEEEDGQEELPGEDDDLEGSAETDDDEDKESAEDELDAAYATLLSLPKAHRPLMSDLKNMPRAKLIAWAGRVEEASSEAAAGGSGDAERGRAAPAGAKAETDPAKEAEEAASRWATTRAGIAKTLGIDDESAEGLKPLYDMNETLRAEIAAMRQEREQDRMESREREGRATIDREVRRLERKYPGLQSDDAKVEGLVNHAAALLRGKAAKDATEAFDMAAKAKLGKARRSDLTKHRRNGFSTIPERRGGFTGTDLSDKDYWSRATDLAYSGRKDLISRMRPPEPKRRR